MEITISLAFIAGLVSFISPCVLPLVPAYIGYMGGHVTNRVAKELRHNGSQNSGANTISLRNRLNTITNGLFFVAGFTLVFVVIGLLSTVFINQIGGRNLNTFTGTIGRLGGILIIFFGLHFMGVVPSFFRKLRTNLLIDHVLFSVFIAFITSCIILWGFTGTIAIWDPSVPLISTLALIVLVAMLLGLLLGGAFTTPGIFWIKVLNTIEQALYSDTRRHMTASKPQGYGGAFMMGIIFSAGWTPCIGPVYGAVLTMAANGGSVSQAGVLLSAYSLGLGIPFLLTALMLDSAQSILRRLQKHMRFIELASGSFLIIIGIAVSSGKLQNLSSQFAGQFADFSINLEESVVDLVGNIPKVIATPEPIKETNALQPATTPTDNPVMLGKIGSKNNNMSVQVGCSNPFDGVNAPGNLSFWTKTDFCKHSIPYNEIVSGGPPPDGIPPLDEPNFESINEAFVWLHDESPVIAIEINGEAKAYPLAILIWHEISNDVIGDTPVAVTFCPLCNSSIVFDRRVDGQLLRFGTTGNLYHSDLIMWDDVTQSWWQQFTGQSIVGVYNETKLIMLPSQVVGFGEFRVQYPDGKVLSRETGFTRGYGENPYTNYDSSASPFLFSGEVDKRLPATERVLATLIAKKAVAYPFSILSFQKVINDRISDEDVVAIWQPGAVSALDQSQIDASRDVGMAALYSRKLNDQVLTFTVDVEGLIRDDQTKSIWNIFGTAVDGELKGSQLEPRFGVPNFWFAWSAFHPETAIFGLTGK